VVFDQILALLKSDEGWSPFGYDDKTGKPVSCEGSLTIGHGFVIDARRGVGLPRPVAEFWLRYALNERLDAFKKLWPAYDDQPGDVQLALGCMAYQLGPEGVMHFPRMLRALVERKRSEASMHALDSEWAREQTPARARRIAKLIEGR
jgi:hypothetical protein